MFHRGIRYSGEGAGVPGAPGNLLAGGNFMGGAGSAINPDAFKKDARQQKIYNKGQGTDNPNEREIFLRRTGPQLPLAQGFGSLPGAVGNMAGIDNATFFRGPQIASADPFPPKTPGIYSYPAGMEGVVNVTYPAGSPQYGQPMPSPKHPGRPMEMNQAEFRGLQQMIPGFQNKLVY